MKTYNYQLSANDRISFVSSLSTMLAAGIPILEAVQALSEESKGNLKKMLMVILDDLRSGNRLYVSFTKFPKIFNTVTVNLVKASEEAGTLEVTLKDLKKSIQQQMEFSDKVRAAMFYPLLVVAVFLGVMVVMLLIVVPRISSVFLRLKVPLPLPTKIMIWLSDVIIHNAILVGVGLIFSAGLVGILYWKNKQLFFRAVFSLPVVRTLVGQIDLTRFTHSMYLLLSSGLPMPVALELAQEVILRKDIRHLITQAREKVMSGNHFSSGLKAHNQLVPGIMIKLIEVGEKTGTLDKSMQDISEHLDYEVSKSLKAVTAMLEPLMLIVVGVAVGGMMLAIISPMYGLIGKVGAR